MNRAKDTLAILGLSDPLWGLGFLTLSPYAHLGCRYVGLENSIYA